MSNPEELDTRIQQLVEDTLQRHQEQTLAAATSVAETIASRFLDSQQSKIDKALESQKKLASVNLKGKGNQHQFNFCQNVMDKFDKAADSLADKDIEKAQKLLSEGKTLVEKRIKLIKLADREDWVTVNEYLSDDLASDSEDEKLINRAIRSANAKSEKRRKLKQRTFPQRMNFDRSRPASQFQTYFGPRYSGTRESPRLSENIVCWGCEHSVVGKLQQNLRFWQDELDTSPFVLNGCIEEVSNVPNCCNPLTVAEGNKLRLVLDLRHVNDYLTFPKFKYEDLKILSQHLETDYYFSTFDLKHGYHHIPIHEHDRKYLGFPWTFPDNTVKYYQFLVLPFGLASACYAFTKLTRPLLTKWRKDGIRCTMYLDNGIFGSKLLETTKKHSAIIQNDLARAGLTINLEKSKFEPRKTGKWLGFNIDTRTSKFYVPSEKLSKLFSLVKLALNSDRVSAKFISKIAGRIISMTLAIGPLTRLFTRHMYRFIESRITWQKLETLDEFLKSDLLFWYRNLFNTNGYQIKKNTLTTKVIYSDASDSGYGGYVMQRLGDIIARGNFTSEERRTSSTYRELLAVKLILQAVGPRVKNESVQGFSDNVNVTRITEVGSRRPHLQKLALEIFDASIIF
ncbi:uncharacterized protein LOC130646058 [Hydractinia symbiolongicarpus]|uniref:uncharacterized protein LOC130646058 n=1 Tax=Hydractinia symbiolongicarpus TaxID=13093 RepID=UPI00254FDECA|nr:uncharacterized protein LOC130646058 [Hydractinia symbiolongicarpus]